MKKKLFLGYSLFLISNFYFGQVGIGTTTPDPSSILELSSANKGLLITRVALQSLTDNTTITTGNVESLLVYNTTVNTELKKGYYYWSGTKWELLSVEGINDWSTLGNSGTNPASNFLGTTDNQPVLIKTNNVNRLRVGSESSAGLTNLQSGVNSSTAYTGNVTNFNSNTDLLSGAQAANVYGIDNLMYLRSGSTITGTFRAQRNRLWNVQTANYPNVIGVLNEYRGEGTDITTFYGFQNTYDFRIASNTTDLYGFSNNFTGQVNGTITNYYGFFSGVHSSLGGATNYYGFYQPNLGTASNRFAFLYKGNGTSTKDVSVTGLGRVGVGTSTPNSQLQVEGSVSTSYITTGTSTGTFNVNENHYTIRVFNDVTTVNLPNPTTCPGRIYILIGSNGITNKNLTVTGGGSIYDDVANTTINTIVARQRYQLQSDGTTWIVIGN